MISPCKIWSKSLHITRFIFHLQVYIWCVETCAFALGGHKTPGELRKQLHRHLVKGVFIKINFLDQNSLEFRRWPCPVWKKTWWVKRGVWCRCMWNQGKGGESSNVQNDTQTGQQKGLLDSILLDSFHAPKIHYLQREEEHLRDRWLEKGTRQRLDSIWVHISGQYLDYEWCKYQANLLTFISATLFVGTLISATLLAGTL